MKQIVLSLSILAITGCTYYKDNLPYATTPNIRIDSVLTPNITIGDRVSGEAVCSDILFIFHDTPSEQTYGATINAQTDVTSNSACAAAAVYNALSRSNDADVLIAPKFTSITNSFLCLPFIGCFIKTQHMFVDAHEGTITYKSN